MVCQKLTYKIDTTDPKEIKEIDEATRSYSLGTALLLQSDPVRYGNMLVGLENAFLEGEDKWPATLTAAYARLTKWASVDKRHTSQNPNHYEETTFTTDSEEVNEPKP